MKRTLLRALGKTILWVSPIIWKFKGDFWFDVHQALGRFVIVLNHRYGLDLYKDDPE
jgi:hypothetical protein